MIRTVAAFLIAPLGLAAALVLIPGVQGLVASVGSLPMVLMASAIAAYAIVLTAVLPVFIALRLLGYTRFWVAAFVGGPDWRGRTNGHLDYRTA
jgi:hypothetical protein